MPVPTPAKTHRSPQPCSSLSRPPDRLAFLFPQKRSIASSITIANRFGTKRPADLATKGKQERHSLVPPEAPTQRNSAANGIQNGSLRQFDISKTIPRPSIEKNLGTFTMPIITPSRPWFRPEAITTQSGTPRSATRLSNCNNLTGHGTIWKKNHTPTKHQWQSLPLAHPIDTSRYINDKCQSVTARRETQRETEKGNQS